MIHDTSFERTLKKSARPAHHERSKDRMIQETKTYIKNLLTKAKDMYEDSK